MTVLLTLPVNISNPNICEIIPLKSTMLIQFNGRGEKHLQISIPSPKGRYSFSLSMVVVRSCWDIVIMVIDIIIANTHMAFIMK